MDWVFLTNLPCRLDPVMSWGEGFLCRHASVFEYLPVIDDKRNAAMQTTERLGER